MKKELKNYIKTQKLSDDDILKLLQTSKSSESEDKDVKDEPEDQEEAETESASENKETPVKADNQTAEKKESDEKAPLKAEDIAKLVEKAVADALKKEKKSAPRPNNPIVKPNQWGLRTE